MKKHKAKRFFNIRIFLALLYVAGFCVTKYSENIFFENKPEKMPFTATSSAVSGLCGNERYVFSENIISERIENFDIDRFIKDAFGKKTEK